MATYAIGDIQGCYQTFQKLLNKINYQPETDQLWLAGDLINRGAGSLQTLQFIYQHRQSIRCVLGNHDLHFLAVESGHRKATKKDTFEALLQSPMRAQLVDWLTQQPLFYHDPSANFAMVHAGIPAGWTVKQAQQYANEVSQCLQSDQRELFFQSMYGNLPQMWHEELTGMNRLRYITNALTRMRYVYPDGALELDAKQPIGKQSSGLIPWFKVNNQIAGNLVFGHWASLEGRCEIDNIFALDTGCVWGGKLTALRLEDKKLFQCRSIG